MANRGFEIEIELIHELDYEEIIKAFSLNEEEIKRFGGFHRYYENLDDELASLIGDWILFHHALRDDMIADWTMTISGWAPFIDQQMRNHLVVGIKERMERIVREFHEIKQKDL